MDTNRLKKFAQQGRTQLLYDVKKRLLYWGIDPQGNVVHHLEKTSGGYLFRGDVHNDASIPAKWESLVRAIDRHSVQDIIEEAAYTWFNRLIAMKILEKNGYDQPALAYVSDAVHDPQILQNAKRGILPTSNTNEINALKHILVDANDDEQFSSLLIYHCRNHQLLNQVFGHLDDYTELLIPNHLMSRGGFLELLNDPNMITVDDFQEVELIGWLYQFYISEKKDDVFASFKKKKKARAEDIPAATQIFTPKWIVKYLVENTVGKLWLDLHPESPIRESMKYLVEPQEPTKDDAIIKDVTELKVLDPAVGSGHFLVVAFDLLMQMYKEEGYSKRQAVTAIIDNNLHGLDICPRAAGLANFAILLKAALYHPDVLREAHYPKVYAMPEPFDFSRQQIEHFLGEIETSEVDEIHSVFKTLKQGQNVGSALILNLSGEARAKLQKILYAGDSDFGHLATQMTYQRMLPFAKVANILTDHFPAVLANPPYMGSKNMNADMVEYLKAKYPRSKSDLAAVFMEVLPARTMKRGSFGFITTPSWMFLGTYKKLREMYVNNYSFKSLLHLSRGVFGADFGAVATVVKKDNKKNSGGEFYRLIDRTFQEFESEDLHQLLLAALRDREFMFQFSKYTKGNGIPKESESAGKRVHFGPIIQSNFSKIPGSPLAYWVSEKVIGVFEQQRTFGEMSEAREGMATGKNEHYVRNWCEVDFDNIGLNIENRDQAKKTGKTWFPYNKGGDIRKWYGNMTFVVNWKNDGHELQNKLHPDGHRIWAHNFNLDHIFRSSVSWADIASKGISMRYYPPGFIFDASGISAFFADANTQFYALGILNTSCIWELSKILNPTMHFKSGDYRKLPYVEVDDARRVISLAKENISISKRDWDSHELSWDFESPPQLNSASSLSDSWHIWMSEVTIDFLRLKSNEEELNKIFIHSYGMENELNGRVKFEDITILQEEVDQSKLKDDRNKSIGSTRGLPLKKPVVLGQLLSYSIGCFMGRYRLDKSGLHIADSHSNVEQLSAYKYRGFTFEIDDDAIIPMMGSESPFSDDIVQRVQQFVLMIWGEDSYTENLNFIQDALGVDLEKFLTKKFWEFHKKMYKKHPIYWQFASPKGAFKVLTYMHRMNKFTVQKIRQDYLFKQMNYLDTTISQMEKAGSDLSTSENRRLDKLRDDLKECRDYDLLLKDVADRQIEFDLDDGVVENYKLFEGVVSPI
jgi:hypothetical protein